MTDPDTTAKAKVNSQSNSDTLMGIAISVVNTDKKPDCAGKNKFFNGTCNKCGAHELIVLLKLWHIWNLNLWLKRMRSQLESSLWNGFTHWNMMVRPMASLTDALVRLLLDSRSGVSACSLEFAPHVKTHWKFGARTLSNRPGAQAWARRL